MKRLFCMVAGLALLGAAPAPTPDDIVQAAPAADWVSISPDDLLVMDLAPDAAGRPRAVMIQLIPAPFSQGWVDNIKLLAAAHWWDGTSVYRVQDNYVAQWGDANADDPKLAKKLPEGLAVVPERNYAIPLNSVVAALATRTDSGVRVDLTRTIDDAYGRSVLLYGWPMSTGPVRDDDLGREIAAPIHCYATVGVARDLPPDTGSGAELYTVIGTPPRQLDRNLAIIGRVIAGIENLSSLPRGTGDKGFYKTAAERVQILSIRLASALPPARQPHFQYLSTESASFAHYAEARANRRDPFFIAPAGGADICNIPVPIRRAP